MNPFDILDKYLEEKDESSIPERSEDRCCDDEYNQILSLNLLCMVCVKCGKVIGGYEIDDKEMFKNPHVVKTYVSYSYNNKAIHRLHKWNNTPYCELELYKMNTYIDKLPDINDNVKRIAKILLKDYYIKDKIVSRNNIRRGLFCYCIYRGYLHTEEDVDIDYLFKILKINSNHYNNAVKKVKEDKLFYPQNINKYMEKIDNKINKNTLIKKYNILYSEDIKFNKKTIILSLIYYLLKKNNEHKDFFKLFNISKISVRKVEEYIVKNKLI